jgi:hypothetical protein
LIKRTKASASNKPAFSLKGVIRRELKAGEWKAEVGAGGTIWQNPADGCWYDELRALALLKEGLDPGDPS